MSGPTRVQPSAAEYYARVRKLSVAAATDELLRIMAAAKESATDPGCYRYRNQSDGIDVHAWAFNGCIVSVEVRRASKRPPPTLGKLMRQYARKLAARTGAPLTEAVAAMRADPYPVAERTKKAVTEIVDWCNGEGMSLR